MWFDSLPIYEKQKLHLKQPRRNSSRFLTQMREKQVKSYSETEPGGSDFSLQVFILYFLRASSNFNWERGAVALK